MVTVTMVYLHVHTIFLELFARFGSGLHNVITNGARQAGGASISHAAAKH